MEFSWKAEVLKSPQPHTHTHDYVTLNLIKTVKVGVCPLLTVLHVSVEKCERMDAVSAFSLGAAFLHSCLSVFTQAEHKLTAGWRRGPSALRWGLALQRQSRVSSLPY